MTIFLFLLDTSSSMNQRAVFTSGSRMPLIDIAKQAVERILKHRSTKAESRSDRYMLMTLEEPPYNIKIGWKENIDHFKNELKNLKPHGTTSLSAGLKNAFDYLNLNRLSITIDSYGNGRQIHFHEFAFIITITDGSKYSSFSNATFDLQLPPSRQTNPNLQDLTIEPYRWDQRLFSLVLKMPSVESVNSIKEEAISSLDNMCQQTGGRSYIVTSRNTFYQSIDNLVQKFQNGVMIRFLKNDAPSPPPQPWMDVTNFVHVRNRTGYSFGNWPIPEAFWVDQTTTSIPPRTAHPVFRMTCLDSAPSFVENLPFDKFELESSPLTRYIISRNCPNSAWQLYVANSQRGSDLGQPFGYLKRSTQNPNIVNMFILPYNYPVLFSLLEEFSKSQPPGKPSREWRTRFDAYLRSIPSYYMPHLKKALGKMGAHNLILDGLEIPNPNVTSHHKRLKHSARQEQERMAALVGKQRPPKDCTPVLHSSRPRSLGETVSNPNATKVFSDIELPDPFLKPIFLNFKSKKKTTFRRNDFCLNFPDISSDELLQQCTLLENILNSKRPLENYAELLNKETVHNMAISKMGDYQEANKNKLMPLRELDPTATSARQPTFGNPFKNKKQIADIDEVMELMDNDSSGGDSNNNGMNGGGMSPMNNGNNIKGKKRPGEILPMEPRMKRKQSFAYFRDNSISDILSSLRGPDSPRQLFHKPPNSPVPMALNGQPNFSISTFDGQRFSEPQSSIVSFGAQNMPQIINQNEPLSPISSPVFGISNPPLNGLDRVPIEITSGSRSYHRLFKFQSNEAHPNISTKPIPRDVSYEWQS